MTEGPGIRLHGLVKCMIPSPVVPCAGANVAPPFVRAVQHGWPVCHIAPPSPLRQQGRAGKIPRLRFGLADAQSTQIHKLASRVQINGCTRRVCIPNGILKRESSIQDFPCR